MGVSKNSGTPKSSILKGFSIINHPFWGIPIFGNTQIRGVGQIKKSSKNSSRDAGLKALKISSREPLPHNFFGGGTVDFCYTTEV